MAAEISVMYRTTPLDDPAKLNCRVTYHSFFCSRY